MQIVSMYVCQHTYAFKDPCVGTHIYVIVCRITMTDINYRNVRLQN